MMMSWIDWLIVLIPLLLVAYIAIKMQKHVSGVAEFMAGGRLGGRYLVCNARGEMGMAVIGIVATFELLYEAGFTLSWWQKIGGPLGMFIALSGYIIFRYRETRAMTLAQFFEIRYSKAFRMFAGILAFVAGVINYGIFPAVSSRFFVYFCGFPQDLNFGAFSIPTFVIIMAIYLSISLTMALTGGQLTLMVTDCIEGLLGLIMFLFIIAAVLIMFDWSHMQYALASAPPGKSMLDPFDIAKAKDFNIWYVLIGMMGAVYSVMAWQGNQAFNSCAKNAHEAKMGSILGSWRNLTKSVMMVLLGIGAITLLKHPDFASQAAQVQGVLDHISNPQIQTQMRVPVAINFMLPVAIKGMLCSLMLFGMLSMDSSYLHSWGSIFIQDIILPYRKKELSPKQHIRLLRWAIFGVAVFGFCFSLLFRQTEYIFMFFAITGAIFLGGAGAVIAGGLYWKKGTTEGAWAAMIVGSSMAGGGIILQQCWKSIHSWLLNLFPQVQFLLDNPQKFPLNGQVMFFWTMVASITMYIVISLLTCRQDFNMEKMLHRGQYVVAGDELKQKKAWSWGSVIGIDANFTRGDKIIAISIFGWSMFWWVVFLIVTCWNLFDRWPISWWATYWKYYALIIPLFIGTGTTFWFLWGGIHDLRQLFRDLKVYKSEASDDGSVTHNDESVESEKHAE